MQHRLKQPQPDFFPLFPLCMWQKRNLNLGFPRNPWYVPLPLCCCSHFLQLCTIMTIGVHAIKITEPKLIQSYRSVTMTMVIGKLAGIRRFINLWCYSNSHPATHLDCNSLLAARSPPDVNRWSRMSSLQYTKWLTPLLCGRPSLGPCVSPFNLKLCLPSRPDWSSSF